MGNMELLRNKIKDSGITYTAVARKIGVTRETLYNRLDEKSEFKASEIACLSDMLRLKKSEQDAIFFDK